MVEFRLLGPVEIWAGDRRVEGGQPRQRAVLAALAADAGRTVSPDILIDRVWGDAPPAGARRSLHAHITRIRRMLDQAGAISGDPAPLVHRDGGYRLDGDPERVDLHRARGLLDRSREPAHDRQRQVELLRQAVPLWRGEPLTGVPGQWAERMRQSWRQLRSNVMLAWSQAELAVGNLDAVISRLSELTGEDALSEPLTAALMRALHAAGRPAEALDQYTTIRRRLVEELGADPSAELQALHQQILRGDLDLPPAPAPADEARPHPVGPPAPSPKPGRRRLVAAAMTGTLLLGLGTGSLGTVLWMKRPVGDAEPDTCTNAPVPAGRNALPAGAWWANEPSMATLTSDGRHFAVTVPRGTKRPGDVLVIMSDVVLADGHDYALAFTAATDRESSILVRVQDSQPPDFFPSFSHYFRAGPGACRHVYQFTGAKTSPRSELTFQVGGQPDHLGLQVSDVVLVET